MANYRWVGNAVAVTQVDSAAVANTWATNDTATLSIGGKDFVVTVGSLTTTAQVATTIKQAFNGETLTDTTASCVPTIADGGAQAIPEFAEITASVSSSTVYFTGNDPGIPFTITASESTAGSGTFGAVSSVTACTGPNFANNADNWKDDSGTNGTPSSTDTIIINAGSTSILYALTALTNTGALEIELGYTGEIGLPDRNANGYDEYRTKYWRTDAASIIVGRGSGTGSRRINLNSGATQTALTVHGSGQPATGLDTAVNWQGTHASNAVTVLGGAVSIGYQPGAAAVVATLQQTASPSVPLNRVVCANMGSAITTFTQKGGESRVKSAITTATIYAGTFTWQGGGTLATLNLLGGTMYVYGSSTITTCTISGEAVLDFSRDGTSRAVTNRIERQTDKCKIHDPLKSVSSLVIDCNQCGNDLSGLDLGTNYSLTRGTVS